MTNLAAATPADLPTTATAPLTVEQAVLTGYAHANGDLQLNEVVALGDIPAHREVATSGDSLLAFLLSELVDEQVACAAEQPEDPEAAANTPDHWEEALRRIATVKRQIERVERMLHEHAPEEADHG